MHALLDGRVALITGGTRGLGLAIATCFAAAGAKGAALDLATPGRDIELPAGFDFQPGDVSDEATLEAAVAAVLARHGRLDVVVANAGLVPPWRDTGQLDLAEWDQVMAVNVRGVAATLKHSAPALKIQGGSAIVMASINAFLGYPQQMLYTASKHAVLGIIRTAARDLGPHNIRVNGLAPGPIATEAMVGRIRTRAREGGPAEEQALAALAADNALRRLVTAEEVAKAALFLASDLASGVSGELLPVDAGFA